MPIKAVKQFFAWSYSRLNDYEKCPLSAKLKHLDKITEPPNDAMARGGRIDKLAESYATGAIDVMPPELKLFAEEFDGLRKIKRLLQPQQDIALTKDWTPTSWFGKDAWVRIKMDVFYDLVKKSLREVIDYKTGKIRPEHMDQLQLYAVGGFAAAEPSIKKANTHLWYLDQGETRDASYTRAEAEKLKPVWEKRVTKMLNDTTFKATPGDHCRWCYFGQSQKKDPSDPRNPRKQGPGLCKF